MKGQDLKRRITGVQETVKITKAMQMIAASKMFKTQQRFESSRKFLLEVKKSIRLLMNPTVMNHPYFDMHVGNRIAYIVISGDKGFCGDYNQLIFDAVFKDMQARNVVKIFAVGEMAIDFFKKKGIEVSNSYIHLLQNPMPDDARAVTNDLIKRFVEEKIDKVYLVFTEIFSLSRQKVTIKKILFVHYVEQNVITPILTKDKDISALLGQYVWAEIYYALTSAALAINYKTMIAMQQATSNGEEMTEQLKLEYNHKRQENITTELVDVSTSLQGKRI